MNYRQSLRTITLGVLLVCMVAAPASGQENQKLAQSGFQFLGVVSDARAAALGEAMTSLRSGSSALFFNPAGMAGMNGDFDFTASTNKWIADITHTTFSAAVNPWHGDYGILGFSIQHIDYGEFLGTRVNSASPKGYDDTGTFSLSALALGLGYAKQLSERFSVGAHVRWVRQDLGESMTAVNIQTYFPGTDSSYRVADTVFVSNKLSPLVFDFGTQFKTGFKSLVFGMSVRNFSGEVEYASEGFQAPLVFTLGISIDVMDFIEGLSPDHSLYCSIDASHHRDHPEQLKIGLEYTLMDLLSLRAGYASSNNDETNFSYGIGVSKYGIAFDYAYTPYGVFDAVQRMTVRFSY
ncbi:MAG: hypothetical protein H6Q31_768 [Bacteroidetes bacterium]|jgi:hypothetical protein|nr:hypothetical protein [Bacteroidota bacterium]